MSGHVLPDQQRLVLESVGRSATAFDVAVDLTRRGHHVQQNVVAKRLTELGELEMIELTGEVRPGSSHRNQQAWRLTDKGRDYLADRSAA